MKRFVTLSTVLVAFFLLATGASAQRTRSSRARRTHTSATVQPVSTSPDESTLILQAFDSRFAVMDSIVAQHHDDSTAAAQPVAGMQLVEPERVAAIDEVVEARIAAMKARTGLEISGQTYVRPGAGLSYDPEDPLVAYNAKVQVELEWNIFQSSLYKRQSKIRELELAGNIQQLEHEKQAIEQTLVLQKMVTRRNYYAHLLQPLRAHSENLNLLMRTQTFLLQNGKISSDDLLKLINEKAELERQLVAIKADSVLDEIPTVFSAEYIQVDTAALLAHLQTSHLTMRKKALEMDLLDAKANNIDYLQTMSIEPFVRFSYYNRENVHNTHNVDIGFSFRVPITNETSRQRKAILAEKQMVDYEQGVEFQQICQEIDLIMRDLDNDNENIKGEFERMKELKKYLDMRTVSYQNVAGDYSRIDRLQEYNAYLQSWERLLGYQYQRDMKLINLQSYLNDQTLDQYLIRVQIK